MFFRYFSLIVTFGISLYADVYAVNKDDICITYRVPAATKQKFFNDIIDSTVPGKTAPDPYHVTLMLVENVNNPQHYKSLQTHLLNIRDQSCPNAHYTPGVAFELLPAKAIVIKSNDVNEEQQFKDMNSLLYSEVMKFNLQHNTSYKVQGFLEPKNYKHHVTIANHKHLVAHGLNAQQVIQDVNLKITNYNKSNGAPFDLLQTVQPKPPVVTPKAPVVTPKKKPVATVKKAAPKHKKRVAKPRKQVAKLKKHVARPKKHAPKHRKHAPRVKKPAPRHKKPTRRHKR